MHTNPIATSVPSGWHATRRIELVMLIHRPPRHGAGVDLWRGLVLARDEGLTSDIGVSNYSPSQIDELIEATGEPPVINQVRWSPFGWDPDLLEHAAMNGVVVQAYSPLTRARRLDEPALVRIGRAHDKSPAQVLIRWNLQHGVVPLPKANRLDHLAENVAVFDFQLADAEMAELDGMRLAG